MWISQEAVCLKGAAPLKKIEAESAKTHFVDGASRRAVAEPLCAPFIA
jgi:hypothetical protein